MIKDSGKTEEFSTGYIRDSREGKGLFSCLPMFALERLAKLFEAGSKKYGEFNCYKGAPFTRCIDSGLRHAVKYSRGDDDEDHLIACVFNFIMIAEYEERIKLGLLDEDLDDRLHRRKK